MEASSDNKGVIVKAGAIPWLVVLLRRTDSPETQEAAAHVLADLSRNTAGNKAIMLAGGIPSLVGLLKIGSLTAMKHALCALWGLTCGSPGSAHYAQTVQNIATVTRAGTVPLLINMMSASARGEVSPEHLGYAVATLNNLAHDVTARTAIVDGSGVEIMMPLMKEDGVMQHPWLKIQACEFLQQLGVDADAGPVKLNLDPLAPAAGGQKKGARQQGSARPQFKVHAGQGKQFTAR